MTPNNINQNSGDFLLQNSPFCEILIDSNYKIIFSNSNCNKAFSNALEQNKSIGNFTKKIINKDCKEILPQISNYLETKKKSFKISFINNNNNVETEFILHAFRLGTTKKFDGYRIIIFDNSEIKSNAIEKKKFTEKIISLSENIQNKDETLKKVQKEIQTIKQKKSEVEEILTKINKDFETIFNTGETSLVIVDLKNGKLNKIIDANKSALELLKLKKEQFSSINLTTLFHKSTQESLKAINSKKTNQHFSGKVVANGKIIPVSVSTSSLIFNNKKSILLAISNRSEEEILLKRLSRSQERYKAFLEYTDMAIYRVEYSPPIDLKLPLIEKAKQIIKNGYVAECNNSFAQLYGFESADTMVGKTFKELWGSSENLKNLNSTIDFIKSKFNKRNLITVERNLKGEERLFSNNVYGIVENKTLVRNWGIQSDITDLEKMKKDLVESKAELYSFIEQAPIPIVIINQDLVAEYFNIAMERTYGYKLKNIPTLEIWWKKAYRHTKISERNKKWWLSLAMRAEEAKKGGAFPKSFPTKIETKNGKYKDVEFYFSKIGSKFLISIIDITDKKNIENDLLKSKREYEILFNNVPIGVFKFDEKGIINTFNDTFVEILGSTRSKLSGFNLIKNLKNKNVLKSVKRTLKGESALYEGEYQSVTSGKKIQIRLLTNPITENEIITGVGILEDVSFRVEAQKEIEKTRDEYKKSVEDQNFIFSKMNDIIYRHDKERNYQFITPSIKKVLGYSTEEFLTKGGKLFTDNRINIDAIKNTNAILQGEKIPSYITEMYHKNGKKVLLEVRETAVKEKGEIVGLVGIARDVTKQKKEEIVSKAIFDIVNESEKSKTLDALYPKLQQILQRLMPAKNMFLAIFNPSEWILSFPYYIDEMDDPEEIITDVEPTNGITEYVLRNKKNYILSRKDIEQLVIDKEVDLMGTLPAQLLAVYLEFEDGRSAVLMLQDYHNPNAYGTEEMKIVKLVSSQIAFSIHKGLQEQELLQSNRQLREAEIELKKQAEELTKINANKDKFFSIIAHDLRSPFTALLGLSRMLTESIDDFTVSELKEISTSLYNSSHNIFKLIENLLNWSRMQLGSLQVVQVDVRVFEIVTSTILTLQENAKQKSIEIKNSINKDHHIFVDPLMMETAIRNLVNNSIKFTAAGGEISISSKKKKGKIIISISDTGIGMDKDIISKLFDITQKVSREGTEREAGTGLGLILVKELVEKNNGKIEVESEVGKGTTFRVILNEKK